jgi:beta-lactamase regulating signal transducer with metallopeptidase domain
MKSLFETYIQNSVYLSLAALLIMFVSPLLARRYSAKCRYYLLIAVFAAMVLPVRPSLPLPDFMRPLMESGAETAAVNATAQAAQTIAANGAGNYLKVLAIAWTVGALAFLAWHIICHLRFMSMVKRWSAQAEKAETLKMFEQIKTRLGVRRGIELKVCPCVKTPMMVGFRQPAVLLPGLDIPQNELRSILTHELIHLKRRDLYCKTLMLLAMAIHWYNPVVHILFRQACGLCEIACDEDALKGADEDTRARYGETIIGVIRSGGEYKTALSTNFYSGTKGVKQRIYALMDMRKKRFSPILMMVVIIAALCCVTGVAAMPAAAEGGEADGKTVTEQDFARDNHAVSSVKTQDADNESPSVADNEDQEAPTLVLTHELFGNGQSQQKSPPAESDSPQLVLGVRNN